jgi:hypothetical protein
VECQTSIQVRDVSSLSTMALSPIILEPSFIDFIELQLFDAGFWLWPLTKRHHQVCWTILFEFYQSQKHYITQLLIILSLRISHSCDVRHDGNILPKGQEVILCNYWICKGWKWLLNGEHVHVFNQMTISTVPFEVIVICLGSIQVLEVSYYTWSKCCDKALIFWKASLLLKHCG